MKKLSTLILLILIAFAGHTQNDSTMMSKKDLRRKLVELQLCKDSNIELSNKMEEYLLLQGVLAAKDITIKELDSLNQNNLLRFENYNVQVKNLTDQNSLMEKGIKDLEKQLKKQKAKTILTGISGIVAFGGLMYLFNHH